MAITTEDGTGLANAESYASVTQADAYHAARGNTAWASLTTDRKEQCLRLGTDYMQQEYRGKWLGMKLMLTQALDWPRLGVFVDGYESPAVPGEIVAANIELALRASSASLAPDLGSQKQSVKVGPIETSYFAGTRQTLKYQAVDNMLAAYMGGRAGVIQVVRA